jgi:hypothetical protein
VEFGGVTLNAGAKAQVYTEGLNLLYVPARKVLGGSLGVSVTIPVSHVNYDATIGVGPFEFSKSVSGWGLGDIVPRAQLGYTNGAFADTFYLQVVTPTGFWEPGFSPITGLHRPGIDGGWAFTWQDPRSKIQVNGAVGMTFNFENTATDYLSGEDLHFEWAVGPEVSPGLVIGAVGYDYVQISGDSGSGAKLGPFEGRVNAVGPGLSYTTVIDKTPVVLALRNYTEFGAVNRFEGNSTIASGTIRF